MMLNPKAGLFWVSMTGLLLGAEATSWIGVIAVAVTVVMSLLWHGALGTLFSSAAAIRTYRRFERWLEAALGMVLGGLGLRVLAG